jgi:hypothetical protein
MAAEDDVATEVAMNLGTVFVTQKADLGVSYVVTPSEPASIELTGVGFTSGDRIMVIDCFGTCGFTEGSTYVSEPTYAVLPTMDRPSMPEFETVYPDKSAATFTYGEPIVGKYCPGNMLPVVEDTLHEGHLCYKVLRRRKLYRRLVLLQWLHPWLRHGRVDGCLPRRDAVPVALLPHARLPLHRHAQVEGPLLLEHGDLRRHDCRGSVGAGR